MNVNVFKSSKEGSFYNEQLSLARDIDCVLLYLIPTTFHFNVLIHSESMNQSLTDQAEGHCM